MPDQVERAAFTQALNNMPVKKDKTMKKINNISIDQISLMVPIKATTLGNKQIPDEVQAIKHVFKFNRILGKPEKQNHAFNGYTNALRYGTDAAKILIMWSWKQPWMGVSTVFYGQGKKLYESLSKMNDIKVDWHELIGKICLKFKGHVSRIDVAVDLINYGFSVDAIANKLKQGKYQFINGVTKRAIGLEKIKTIGDSGEIDTIYVNSRQSDSFLRIYNKRKESLSSKSSGYYLMAKNTENFIRIEAEFKHREAHRIGNNIAELTDARKLYSFLANRITQHWILIENDKEKK